MSIYDKAKTSKTFCILPWVHQYVGPLGDVKPCCAFEPDDQFGSMKENTLKEIWNNETTRDARLKMLNGEQVPGCIKCDKRAGIVEVFRDEANIRFLERNKDVLESTLEDGTVPEHSIKYFDARFNNLCNLRCRTCGPRFSTSWHEEYVISKGGKLEENDPHKKAFVFPGKTEDQLLNEIWEHIPNVQHIYFAGGEPLMQQEHYKVLEELVRLGHTGSDEKPLHIYYNTNFSQLKLGKYSATDLWKNFNDLMICASIDGSYEKAEYWRKGTKWANVVANRESIKENCPNVNFRISFTLSWVNAYNLVDLHREWYKLGYIDINGMGVNLLDTPPQHSLKYLPKWKKEKIEQLFVEQMDWIKQNSKHQYYHYALNYYTEAIKFMYSYETTDEFIYKDKFLGETQFFDNLRGENFWDVFPEHQDMKEFLGA